MFARVMATYTGVQFFRGHGVVSLLCFFLLCCWSIVQIKQFNVDLARRAVSRKSSVYFHRLVFLFVEIICCHWSFVGDTLLRWRVWR